MLPLGLVLCYALLLYIVAGGSVRTVLELAELKIFQQTVWFEQYFKQQKRLYYLTTLNEKIELGKFQSVRKQIFI
jgi:hypothetical protein